MGPYQALIWLWGYVISNPGPSVGYPVSLSAGSSYTMFQNVVYDLPVRITRISSDLELESSLDGTTWAALVGSDTTAGVRTSARFIRSPLGDTTVSIKLK